MEFRQIQYFLVVAQELSFSKAAKKSYVSQQAISKSIQALEQELGVPLFTRVSHGVELTQYGQLLLKKAYHISSSVSDIFTELRDIKGNHQKNIPLSIAAGIDSWLDIEKLLKFKELYPQHDIAISVCTDSQIENDLMSEKIEIGIMGNRGTSANISYNHLKTLSTFVAIHEDNPLSNRETLDLADLKDEYFIMTSDEYYACSQLITLCNAAGFNPYIKHRASDIMFVKRMLLLNEGIFFCNEEAYDLFAGTPIKLIPLDNDPKVHSVHLAVKKNLPLSPRAQLLMDYIRDCII